MILEREAIGVEQIRGAVKGDHRLAGTRTSLHDQDTGLWRADDLVLFGLNGGDDVAQLPRSAALDRGHERAVTAQAARMHEAALGAVEPFVMADSEMTLAKEFVLDAKKRRTVDHEVAASGQPHRLTARRSVEGLGDWGPPIDDDRIAVLVGHRQSSDVEALDAVGSIGRSFSRSVDLTIDASEDQGGVAEIEIGQTSDQLLVDGVPLEAVLERSTHSGLGQASDFPGVLSAALQTRVGMRDVGLLVVEIRVLRRHRCREGFMNSSVGTRAGSGWNDVGMKGATPAMVALDRAAVSYQVHHLADAEGGDMTELGYGRAAAQALGVDESRVFKTLLVSLPGGPLTQAVAIVPVSGQLSLKAVAHALGAKRAEMMEPRVAERLTGYVVGGISPFGQRKALPTVIDETCVLHETIFVSGGRRGLDIELAPDDLVGALSATVAAIAA